METELTLPFPRPRDVSTTTGVTDGDRTPPVSTGLATASNSLTTGTRASAGGQATIDRMWHGLQGPLDATVQMAQTSPPSRPPAQHLATQVAPWRCLVEAAQELHGSHGSPDTRTLWEALH